jgi:UDP-N-acetyl-D-mannosaminuronate dehydrogenase
MTCNLTVIGLGYIGLPLASEACQAGLAVLGFDSAPAVVCSRWVPMSTSSTPMLTTFLSTTDNFTLKET